MTYRPDDNFRNDAVNGVLRSLGQAQVPEGLEARVLDRLKARRAVVAALPFWRRPELRWAGAAMVCAAMAFAVVMSAGWRVSQRRTEWASTSFGPGMATLYEPLRVSPRPLAPAKSVHPRQTASPTLPHAPRAAHRMPVISTRSFPAPEAPLTHQEMLLLSAAHVHQPEVIDALDSTRRAALEAEDDREFKAYVASVPHGGF